MRDLLEDVPSSRRWKRVFQAALWEKNRPISCIKITPGITQNLSYIGG